MHIIQYNMEKLDLMLKILIWIDYLVYELCKNLTAVGKKDVLYLSYTSYWERSAWSFWK